ncbi:MAG TPA: TetR/AcrR family transcriptional regulator [Verrucomicrobiae bacterium]|nr:TetR/AcrR family transcriptional regulator [Verrucomicrobiae bacterium]
MPAPTAPATLKPVTARGEATRRRLLIAAEQEFGAKGYHGASVSSITQRADIAQGTFYLYFHSKEEMFVTLVRDIGHQLRAHASQAIAKAGSRLEAERLGLEAFMQFTTKHRGLYRIVQESQFVDPQIFREYYEKLAEGYAAALAAAARKGELSEGDADTRAWSMMGVGHFLGMKWCLWQKKQPPPGVIDEVMKLVTEGMGPKRKG